MPNVNEAQHPASKPVQITLRTDKGAAPYRELTLTASSVEFQPWNNYVEFFNVVANDHDGIEYEESTKQFRYQGIGYEFCSVTH
jgi:hypothetical protein